MSEPGILFPPRHEPLRRDVSVLGALLGEVIREQRGEEFYQRVEAARQAAVERRAGVAGAGRRLTGIVGSLEPEQAEQVVRAFEAYFTLVNMAEMVHRIRRRRASLAEPGQAAPGSLRAVLKGLRAQGVEGARVAEILRGIDVRPVFTAHPTEAVRRTLLLKHQRIARALVDRLDPGTITSRDEEAALGRVREEITSAWQTEEHLSVRPSVADEVEHALFYLSDVVYRIVPAYHREIAESFRAVFGTETDFPGPFVRFGSWVGGDMDGNPNVGPDTIRATLRRHREMILGRYMKELRGLFDRLSQSSSRVGTDPGVLRRTAELRALLPDVFGRIPVRYHGMPYRVLLWHVHARLGRTLDDDENGYPGPGDLLSDLRLVSESLRANAGEHAGRFRVERLIRRVETFGFHLASLDVRQDARVHRRALAELLGRADFPELEGEERAGILRAALRRPHGDPAAADDPETARVLETMRAIRDCRGLYGEEAVGLFIVSMTKGPDDALAVLHLARQAGLGPPAGPTPLDVTPLFETPDDLRSAGDTLDALLADPLYLAHLKERGSTQFVMLGFSDSAKEGGLAASRFAIHRAQEELVRRADPFGVRIVFFLGRGGTVSRGGGKIRDAILAAPRGTTGGRLRLTEQGEIIHAKYGLRDVALRTLEMMGGAILEAAAREGAPSTERPGWRDAMTLVAGESERVWKRLVRDDPDFFAYFQAATPIDVIGRMKIGSRPAFRREAAGIDDLRAIPWVFAWTQSRLVLPGWYGVGAGLAAARERHGFRFLRRMARDWPFFANLLSDVAMVLAKADLGIAERYAGLAGRAGERLFPEIREEFERTRDLVVSLQGTRELLGRDDLLRRAIALRNPYVDPMSLIQVDLLRRWREGGREDPTLLRALFTTVQGIARGLQNTG